MTAPEVTVVVPVRGDRGGLSACVAALLAQDHPSYEVVLVDNGDNASSPVLSGARRNPRLRVVQEPQKGSYAARNAGVRAARGAVLAFTDADCLPRPDWLSRGTGRVVEAPLPCFVGGRIRLFAADPDRPTAAELFELAEGFPQESYVTRQHFAATASMFVRHEDFDRVGAFDGRLQSGGDREWGVRATALGLLGTYAGDAVVDHPCRATVRELRDKTLRVTRGDADVRRLQGRAVLEPGDVRAWLRPPLRTTVRSTLRLRGVGRAAPVRYLAVAVGLHQLAFVERVRLSRRAGGRD